MGASNGRPEGGNAVRFTTSRFNGRVCAKQFCKCKKLQRHREASRGNLVAPRTVNALLDLLQILEPSSARFQAVIHSLSVRFMPKSSLSRLSKSGMWAAP